MKLRDFIEQLQQLDPDSDVVASVADSTRRENIKTFVSRINREIELDGKDAFITEDAVEAHLFDDVGQTEPEITEKISRTGRRFVCIQ